MRTIATCHDYDELHAALRARAEELNVSRLTIDDIAGLPSGYTGKVLAPTQVKAFGRISLGPLLQTLGLALIVVEDSEALERVQDRLVPRVNRRHSASAAYGNSPSEDHKP